MSSFQCSYDRQPYQWRSGNTQNWKKGGTRFKPRVRLSTQPFGVFGGFLRNSHKYFLGSLRKTLTEGIPPTDPGPSRGQLALKPTTTTKSRAGNVITADIEASNDSLLGSMSVLEIFRVINLSHSIVQKALLNTLYFYPYKINT